MRASEHEPHVRAHLADPLRHSDRRGKLRRRGRDSDDPGGRAAQVQLGDFDEVLDPREVEYLHRIARILEDSGHFQDAKAGEDALVEQESGRRDHQADGLSVGARAKLAAHRLQRDQTAVHATSSSPI